MITSMYSWKNKKTAELFKAFLQLKTGEEMASFCRDLMTEAELEEFASRFQVAKELEKGKTQREVSSLTKVSIATVTRVNQWLKRGLGGYKLVISRLNKNHHRPH